MEEPFGVVTSTAHVIVDEIRNDGGIEPACFDERTFAEALDGWF